MKNIFLHSLILENYRNFKNLELKIDNTPIILIGENGSGKTNILEAISLFYPGRGLRSAKLADICKTSEDHCSIKALLQSKLGLAEFTTQFKLSSNRRITEYNESKIANNELSKFTSMVWLTPQMEGIFTSGKVERRKFLDRIVYNFDPKHAELVSKYEYYMHERNKILAEEIQDDNWLKIIEEKMADISNHIAVNRLKTLEFMQQTINNLENEFPKADLSIDGIVEQKILDGEENIVSVITAELYKTRNKDKLIGRTSFGVHKSDFLVKHKKKNILAKLCSTGEQKAILITIILAEMNYAIKLTKIAPVLLLDEVFVHLDDKRREYLTEFFTYLNLQLWITTTNLESIENFASKAQLIKL
ncbi:DNA replication/repair protein RecF [Rickettsia canadensis]|uniref:DNA replication and repair protein RecF n=1 Tax=Rickettsia canadensis str. CA410 TaxID=1105107 RepID=A0ABM5MQV1_RICCA|nr:DNA replication/repair protein RecF [Rickettsia canadensis]AFB20607.1 recombination protein F [Rickettsia canadensis str. CA410]